MYEEMGCICVVSECANVVLCAVVNSIVSYPIMCGSMAHFVRCLVAEGVGVVLKTLRCMEC